MPCVARVPGPLTHEEARSHIDYDPETGILTWKIRKPRIHPGRRAGNASKNSKKPYRGITVCGHGMPEHVFIWFWMTGEWPPTGMQVDHRNRKHDDNRWENLRLATPHQNQRNTDRYGENRGIQIRDGAKGLRYRVRIRERGNSRNIGTFDTIEAARAAFQQAAREQYGEFYDP